MPTRIPMTVTVVLFPHGHLSFNNLIRQYVKKCMLLGRCYDDTVFDTHHHVAFVLKKMIRFFMDGKSDSVIKAENFTISRPLDPRTRVTIKMNEVIIKGV